MLSKSASQFFKSNGAQATKMAALTTQHQRYFAGGGGPKKPNMPSTNTDFDVVFVGGMNTTALVKFL